MLLPEHGKLRPARQNTAIIWLHAPQPVLLSNADAFRNYLLINTPQLTLYDLPVVMGPNRIAELIDEFPAFLSLSRLPSADAIQQHLARWKAGANEWNLKRKKIPALEIPTGIQEWGRFFYR